MKIDFPSLEEEIQDILNAPEYRGHPAREALERLWDVNQEQWNRVERMTHLSDAYQDMMIQRERSLSERFDKHLRQLEKITRISDRYQRILRQMNQELEEMSFKDPLTELPNRRMMMKRLSQEFERQQDRTLFQIAMFDVDYFKSINDEFGHNVGDEVLISLAKLMNEALNKMGLVCRWGGEEFMAFFTTEVQSDVKKVIEELRWHVSKSEWVVNDNVIKTSISIGLSSYHEGDTIDALLTRADDALYAAKMQGRNRIVMN